MIIAIDGPAGAGKSTVAKRVAAQLGFSYVDSGAMYRTIAANALDAGISPDDEAGVVAIAETAELDQIDETKIRLESVSRAVSKVARYPRVREIAVEKQRAIANQKNIVMEGRDIGSVVFPHAEVKLYLAASVEERARRRYQELLFTGAVVTLESVRTEIIERDRRDQERETSPLLKLPDAVEVDTTGMSIMQVVEAICRIVNARRGF